jgi:DNA-binding MarR family transcriptional regulator
MSEPVSDAHRAYFGLMTVMDPLRFRFWDDRDVTMTQLRVMFLIRERCEPSTGELAELMHIRPATRTGLADRLESKDLIKRGPDPADRRVVRVGLTPTGTALLDEASAAGRAFLDAVFERMGPESVESFICAANAFIAAAEAEHPTPQAQAGPA